MEKDNMKNQVLSIEQMQHLKELGVNLGKHSMEWCIFHEMEYDTKLDKVVRISNEVLEILEVQGKYKIGYDLNSSSLFECVEIIPTYTLEDMLELMPPTLYSDKKGSTIRLEPISYFYKHILTVTKDIAGYMVEYRDYNKGVTLTYDEGRTALEAAYNMPCWLAEHKLLKRKK